MALGPALYLSQSCPRLISSGLLRLSPYLWNHTVCDPGCDHTHTHTCTHILYKYVNCKYLTEKGSFLALIASLTLWILSYSPFSWLPGWWCPFQSWQVWLWVLLHTLQAYFRLFESGVVVINLFGSVSSDNYSWIFVQWLHLLCIEIGTQKDSLCELLFSSHPSVSAGCAIPIVAKCSAANETPSGTSSAVRDLSYHMGRGHLFLKGECHPQRGHPQLLPHTQVSFVPPSPAACPSFLPKSVAHTPFYEPPFLPSDLCILKSPTVGVWQTELSHYQKDWPSYWHTTDLSLVSPATTPWIGIFWFFSFPDRSLEFNTPSPNRVIQMAVAVRTGSRNWLWRSR